MPFLLTTVIGPGQLLVAAKVDFADTATVADIERAADEAERRLVARHPGVRYVFLDPTPGDGRAQVAAPEPRNEPAARGFGRFMQVEVWSDVVCPWCYIGKRKLETALSRFPHADQVEVVWRSFQLDPSIPEGHTEETLPALAAKYGRSVEEMAQMQRRVEEVAPVRASSTTSPRASAATPCSPTSSSTWPRTAASAGR